jgi:3-oxoacyl-(acyl-carrier-protein) synthase III
MKAKITSLAYYLPEKTLSSSEMEEMLRQKNPTLRVTPGLIESATGIVSRRVAAEDEFNSDLAAKAAQKTLAQSGTSPEEIDLLIFAAAGQDLIEPATSHIVQDILGTHAPLFDIKNACNSFVNALEIAESLILTGRKKKILIATGEKTSVTVKWQLQDRNDLKKSFASFTLGDAGAAALVIPSEEDSGIIAYAGTADSKQWRVGTLPGGGSRHPRGDEYTYFQGDGAALKDAFENMGPSFLNKFLSENSISLDEIDRVFMHQVSIDYLESFITTLGLATEKVERTIQTCGNVGAATIPLGMCQSLERGALKKGELVLMVGMAGGVSLELLLMRW